ncbi:hypothetical protein MNEG_8693 [Monoraphidium neglectum]|uniref:Uncharacterized protein n=1 Tax=Monoraphidium neglectum TaxID=145388 RepID=A0A0D2KV69_9CHLO|nr:hypothetical protein MNEG_8693 [Monoraphidium neglectum]KIY99268.1 hypothetical protein MNEG_8693 [Monoraphidium neglectum]|eukprot:XP_013898288.1 hypothetical protein MNEG_8693 [Monoraphidium neglectum]
MTLQTPFKRAASTAGAAAADGQDDDGPSASPRRGSWRRTLLGERAAAAQSATTASAGRGHTSFSSALPVAGPDPATSFVAALPADDTGALGP